jgi:UDP-glucose 4-epimerase
MKVLVTGGAGFVGSHIVQSLANQGASVVVYDNLSTGLRENFSGLSNIKLMDGDILDKDALAQAMRGVDAVSHQAAQLQITQCISDPAADLKTNTVGTLNVLQAMVETGVCRLVYASSAYVYGQAEYTPQDEGHPTNPNWQYGVSKLASEKYCQIYAESHGIKFCALRYSIVYGPRQGYGGVLTIFLRRALQNLPPVVFGDGMQVRDFIYVGDVAALHNRCLEDSRAVGQIFNASTGLGTTICDLARLVCQVTGRQLGVQHEELPLGGHSQLVVGRQRLPAELLTMVLDPRKAKSLLSWYPTVTLQEGLRKEWEWLQENPNRWKELHY